MATPTNNSKTPLNTVILTTQKVQNWNLESFEKLLPDLPPSFPRRRESIESDWLFDAGKDIEVNTLRVGPRVRGEDGYRPSIESS